MQVIKMMGVYTGNASENQPEEFSSCIDTFSPINHTFRRRKRCSVAGMRQKT